MIDFHFIKQLFGFMVRKNMYARKELITGERDWKGLFISSIVAAIFIAAGSAYLFFEINNEQIFQKETLSSSTTAIAIDRQRMKKAIISFEEKERRFDELSRQAPKVFDPSVAVFVR